MSLTALAFAWTFASSRSNRSIVARPALSFLSFSSSAKRLAYFEKSPPASAASDHVSSLLLRSFRDINCTTSS